MKYRAPDKDIVITAADKTHITYSQAALPYTTNDEAIGRAMDIIDKERAGEQLGLYSPFPQMDRLQGKSWKFAQTNAFFSRTGHGKSYFMMQMVNAWSDFEDRLIWLAMVPEGAIARAIQERAFDEAGIPYVVEPDVKGNLHYHKPHKAINKQFVEDGNQVIFLNFYFEMLGSDDAARNLTTLSGMSSSYIQSSEYDPTTGKYNRVSDQEYGMLKYYSNMLLGRPIVYFEISGNVEQIVTTYMFWKAANPGYKFVINIDHVGLIDKKEYQKAMDVVSETAKKTITLRNDGCMTNLICQMNADILSPARQGRGSSQYPLITDIHGSNELGWAVDNAWCVPWRPSVEKLPKYGMLGLNTSNLVIASKVKSRNGSLGEVLMENNLSKGKFLPLTNEQIEKRITVRDKQKSK